MINNETFLKQSITDTSTLTMMKQKQYWHDPATHYYRRSQKQKLICKDTCANRKMQNSKHKNSLRHCMLMFIYKWSQQFVRAVNNMIVSILLIEILVEKKKGERNSVLTSSSVGIIFIRISPTVSMSALMLRMLYVSPAKERPHTAGGVGVPARQPRRKGTIFQIREFLHPLICQR